MDGFTDSASSARAAARFLAPEVACRRSSESRHKDSKGARVEVMLPGRLLCGIARSAIPGLRAVCLELRGAQFLGSGLFAWNCAERNSWAQGCLLGIARSAIPRLRAVCFELCGCNSWAQGCFLEVVLARHLGSGCLLGFCGAQFLGSGLFFRGCSGAISWLGLFFCRSWVGRDTWTSDCFLGIGRLRFPGFGGWIRGGGAGMGLQCRLETAGWVVLSG